MPSIQGLEVVRIPTPTPNDSLEANISKVFDKLGVHVDGKDIQACQCLKDNDRVIIKFSNRKDSFQVLRVKKDLKSLDPTELDFPEGTRIFINESLCLLLWSVEQILKKMVPDINVDNFQFVGSSFFVLFELIFLIHFESFIYRR